MEQITSYNIIVIAPTNSFDEKGNLVIGGQKIEMPSFDYETIETEGERYRVYKIKGYFSPKSKKIEITDKSFDEPSVDFIVIKPEFKIGEFGIAHNVYDKFSNNILTVGTKEVRKRKIDEFLLIFQSSAEIEYYVLDRIPTLKKIQLQKRPPYVISQ